MFIDGHLDLATNALVLRRDLTRPLTAIRREEERDRQELLVTLPELRKGGIGIVFGTIFTLSRAMVRPPDAAPLKDYQVDFCYDTPEEAHELGMEQLEVYEQWQEDGHIRIIKSQADLKCHFSAWEDGDRTTGVVLLMEGADPIREPDELPFWMERGVRIIGPAWQRTQYAGGTKSPGPLTEKGKRLVREIAEHGAILDTSHLATESFWDAMEIGAPHVIASHSNARSIVPGDRHLSDGMIRAIGERDGVIGLVLGNSFLLPEKKERRVSLKDVKTHAKHIAGLIGWERVAIGSDFDGGFGVQETPREIKRGSDFKKLGSIAPRRHRQNLLGGNWLRFLQRALPED